MRLRMWILDLPFQFYWLRSDDKHKCTELACAAPQRVSSALLRYPRNEKGAFPGSYAALVEDLQTAGHYSRIIACT